MRRAAAAMAAVMPVALVAAAGPARADDTRQCEPWYGYSVCYQRSDDTWWMCDPDCSRIPPPVRPFPGLPPELPPDAPPPPAPTPAPPPPPWPVPPPFFPGCQTLNGCVDYSFFPVLTF